MENLKELSTEEKSSTNGGGFPWGPVALLLYVADEIYEGLKRPC